MIGLTDDLARTLGRTADSYEYQMLYGVRPLEQRRLAATGCSVQVYIPYGSDWSGYLMRRIAERPANLKFFVACLSIITSLHRRLLARSMPAHRHRL
jgi:proline dehydrogenase